MLCLTRKLGESISISTEEGEIRLKVLSVNRGKCVLGITAPESCLVLRSELRNKGNRNGIQNEKE